MSRFPRFVIGGVRFRPAMYGASSVFYTVEYPVRAFWLPDVFFISFRDGYFFRKLLFAAYEQVDRDSKECKLQEWRSSLARGLYILRPQTCIFKGHKGLKDEESSGQAI